MDERYQLLETAKDMIPPRAKYTIIGLIAVILALIFAIGLYTVYNTFKPEPPAPVVSPVIQKLPPQEIHHYNETVREVAVQAPSQPGAILQFIEREGKVIAKVGDQEVEVPNQTGQPNVEIGKNGELKISTSSTARIDVTDMANAQAQMIANKAMEEQSKEFKRKRNKERIVEGGILIGAICAAMR